MKKIVNKWISAGIALTFAFATPVLSTQVFADHHGSYGDKKETKNIVEIASGNEDFSTLVTAVKKAGLVETLSGEGPFTVLAPTNDAFAKVPKDQLDALLADKEALTKVLTYHVIPAKAKAKDVVKMDSAKTVEGSEVKIKTYDGKVKINNAKVVKTDIMASNGVIHVIDSVLLPPSMTSDANTASKSIAEIAMGSEDFETLVAALKAADLADTLNTGEGPFTVFAPTDDAFAKIAPADLQALLADKEALKSVLLYHVVNGKVTADEVTKLKSAKTLQGTDVGITTNYGKVKVGGATVTKTDIMASNGVIHVIDTVITP